MIELFTVVVGAISAFIFSMMAYMVSRSKNKWLKRIGGVVCAIVMIYEMMMVWQ